MMKKSYRIFLALWLFLPFTMMAQVELSYYLPEDVSYDPNIPTPQSVLGYQVGEWHVNNDQLVRYMEVLAQESDRISLEVYARTYEHRPLLLLTITSPENHKNIDKIKSEHVALSDPDGSNRLNVQNMPAVVWMGYSVHGNESSGTNASLLVAYHLAAAQGQEIEKSLKDVVILMDPMINPDGNMRFSSWVNSRKSKNLIADPNNHEQNETWPGGRTNHYWFDLNRDWLPVQHPESYGRIKKLQEWKPNIVTDHHEMGTGATFFFQPGIPSRNHPLTPQNTYTLTAKIATYHEKALDNIGSLYYSGESFDDFYYGKGSTYPDINGGVGILFEQASSRGHLQESINGNVSFPFTIRNQFTTSLSTLKAATEIREDLLTHQKEFYQSAIKQAASDPVKAIVFGSEKDGIRAQALVKIIKTHNIDIYQLKNNLKRNKNNYTASNSYVVPLNQKQYRLIKAMFEKRTSFQDSLFYDVSAWTLPLAFNVAYDELDSRAFSTSILGAKLEDIKYKKGELIGGQSNYAYLFEWHGYYAPRALHRLLDAGVRVKVATKLLTDKNGKNYDYGTIMIPVKNQEVSPEKIYAIIKEITEKDGVDVYGVKTGAVNNGIYLGSNNFVNVPTPKIMVLVGRGVSGYDSGEIWHLLDQRFDIPVSLVPLNRFNSIDLTRYNKIVMSDGSYSGLSGNAMDKLKRWIQSGGNVIAMKRASKWLADKGLTKAKFKVNKTDSVPQRPYHLRDRYSGAQVIGGAIFETKLDLSHPLAYGYSNNIMPIFRNSTLFMERNKSPYVNPVMYTETPLLSGYISDKQEEKLKNTAAVNVSGYGSGRIISFTDNLNFRAFWYGTNKMFLNSIFFGQAISTR